MRLCASRVIYYQDPAGNSFVENPNAPAPDPQLEVARYWRSRAQNEALGIAHQGDGGNDGGGDAENSGGDGDEAAPTSAAAVAPAAPKSAVASGESGPSRAGRATGPCYDINATAWTSSLAQCFSFELT